MTGGSGWISCAGGISVGVLSGTSVGAGVCSTSAGWDGCAGVGSGVGIGVGTGVPIVTSVVTAVI